MFRIKASKKRYLILHILREFLFDIFVSCVYESTISFR